jgi:ankyrin repeat protein
MSLFARLKNMGQEKEPSIDDIPIDQLSPEVLDQPPQYTFVAAQHAVKHNQLDKIQDFLNFNPKYVYCKDWDGSTLLHRAAQYARVDILKLLLDNSAQIDLPFNGKTALQLAVESEYYGAERNPQALQAFKQQRLAAVVLLLEHKAGKDYVNDNGEQAIHIAAKLGCAELVEVLLKHGADVEAQISSDAANNAGRTPLLMAVRYARDKATIHLLLNSGAAVNRPDMVTGYNPLHSIVSCVDEKIPQAMLKLLVLLLLKYKADINQVTADAEQQTALHLAIMRQRLELVAVLVANKADLHAKNASAMVPIALAALQGNAELVKFLHEQGSDLYKSKALFYAANCGHSSAALEYLLDTGMDINMPDKKGYTPLFSAISSYSLQNVKLLIERGADIKMHSPQGMTVLEHAFACWGQVECLDDSADVPPELKLKSDNARDIIELLGGFEHKRPKMYF